MATKFLNRYGNGLNEINYDTTQYAPSSHTHTKSQITDFPSTLKNPTSIKIQLNGGTTENTNQYTYDGSSAKTINITASKIGAAASSHSHSNYFNLNSSTVITGNAIKMKTGSYTKSVIQTYAGDANGAGLVIENGGSTFIGGGEAASNLYNAVGKGSESTERLYLASDTHVYIDTNCQTIGSRRQFCFTSGGKLEVPVDVTINGASVKAVINWMNKYNSMLNIIGNNA